MWFVPTWNLRHLRVNSYTRLLKNPPLRFTEVMMEAIDSLRRRKRYSRRMATEDPVFGNIRDNTRGDWFTLSG